MTNREAIKTIEIAIAEVEWEYPMEYAVAFEMAIDALKKQIPKKPKVDERYTLELCPVCNDFVRTHTSKRQMNFCCNCGQALDWSENI